MATFSPNICFITDVFFLSNPKSNQDGYFYKPIKTNKVLLQTENKNFEKCRIAFSAQCSPFEQALLWFIYELCVLSYQFQRCLESEEEVRCSPVRMTHSRKENFINTVAPHRKIINFIEILFVCVQKCYILTTLGPIFITKSCKNQC